MLGVDTNVLVRYITDDDPGQSEVARRMVDDAAEKGELLHVCVPVLCELVWVLGSPAFGYGRDELADTLELLLEIDLLDIEARDVVRTAIPDFRAGEADFVDYLIGRLNRSRGCRTTATFDLAAAESEMFEVLEAS